MSVGEWQINAVDGADVRLRSGRVGLISVDVSAPVASGLLHVSADGITLTLNLSLDQLKTGNFLLQSAARSIVTRNKAHELVYSGKGPVGEIWSVTGIARAGSIEVELDLTITPIASATSPMDAAISLSLMESGSNSRLSPRVCSGRTGRLAKPGRMVPADDCIGSRIRTPHRKRQDRPDGQGRCPACC